MTYNPAKEFEFESIKYRGTNNNLPCTKLIIEQVNPDNRRIDAYFNFITGIREHKGGLERTFFGQPTTHKPKESSRMLLSSVKEITGGEGRLDNTSIDEFTTDYARLLNREHPGYLQHPSTEQTLILPDNSTKQITREEYQTLAAQIIMKGR